MAELLIELLSEEIPARMQARAAEDFRKLTMDRLSAEGLTFDGAVAHVTPRRLALCVDGLPLRQPDVEEAKKGPRVDAPDRALAGFMKANGLSDLSGCEKRESPKGAFYHLLVRKQGVAAAELIPEVLRDVVDRFPWPKSMRWARGAKSWVRPVRSAVCLFDGAPLSFALEFDGVNVPVGAETAAHRFMSPGTLTVSCFAQYERELESRYVLLDREKRKSRIASGAQALAARAGLRVKTDDALVEEIAGLTEWPVPLLGRIDDDFIDLPSEVLTTSMRAHQKYLALETAEGALANRFCVVANIETDDGGAAIVAGNERVLRARLSDAKFFWDRDRETPLTEMGAGLDRVVFHARLGSMGAKVVRNARLAERLAADIPNCDSSLARRAAELAKADLASGMVGEFPELQGIMGRYYAREQAETETVANAIAEHYAPLGPADACPAAPVSLAVALSDKIDTLAGFWAIGEKPTGSKDPFALRRAALGAIRLILENDLRLPLVSVFDDAIGMARKAVEAGGKPDRPGGAVTWRDTERVGDRTTDAVALDLLNFFADRLKAAMRDKGVRHDLIGAVFAVEKSGGGPEDDLVRLTAKVEALAEFLATEDGGGLLSAYRRAANILRIEEKQDGRAYDQATEPSALQQVEEKCLYACLLDAQRQARAALEREDFAGAMTVLATLRAPVDAFFDKVTVNAADAMLRENRLRLLSSIRRTLEQVADFSEIEGYGEATQFRFRFSVRKGV